MLPNSSDEEEDRSVAPSDSDSDDLEDLTLDFNQNDFDVDAVRIGIAQGAKKPEASHVEIESWPPSTYSSSRAIFCVTPLHHAKRDPKFGSLGRGGKLSMKQAEDELGAFGLSHGGFEPCFVDEPPSNIERRMDAYVRAWDMCLLRATKVLSAHISVALSDVCRFVRGRHESLSWGMNILPTAVMMFGVDFSDHPAFFGVLHSKLKSRARSLVFLSPTVCSTMAKLMRSLTKQVIPDITASSEHSFISIRTYAKTRERFALTIVVESLEQWSNSGLLDSFLDMASHYSTELHMTLILAVSSTKDSVHHILSSSVLQHLSIRAFQIAASTTAIDLILKNTIMAPDAPFQLANPVLKWVLENIKFLNYSVSALITKLKFIYWRFYYTHPLSWMAGTSIDAKSFEKNGEVSPELMEPLRRATHRFIVTYPYLTHQHVNYLEWFRNRATSSRLAAQFELRSPPALIGKWKSRYKRTTLLRSVALQLFMVTRHLGVFPSAASCNSNSSNSVVPRDMESLLKLFERIKDEEDRRLSAKSGGHGTSKNLGQVHGLFDETVMERHEWYGCPHTIEYYALLADTKNVVNSAFDPYRNDVPLLKRLFDSWMSIINDEVLASDHPKIQKVLKSLFLDDGRLFEKCGLHDPKQSLVKPPKPLKAEHIGRFLDSLLSRMKDVIVSAFEEDISAHNPLSLELTFSDVAILNRRFNPNIRSAQTNQSLAMVAELHEAKMESERDQPQRKRRR